METNNLKLNCKRCGHSWFPRKSEVRICPKCKSAYFDRPRKNKGGAVEWKRTVLSAAGYPEVKPEPEDAKPGCIAEYGGDPDAEDKAYETMKQREVDEE